MNNPVILRKNIRVVLSSAPRRRFSEKMIVDGLNLLLPEPVETFEFKNALEWNHARNLVESRKNEDTDQHEWFLTDAGKQKEGL